MKITSYNISKFKGVYDKGAFIPEYMNELKKLISNKKLLDGKDDIVILQEVPYKASNKMYELFIETFNKEYDIIEPMYKGNEAKSIVVALLLKDKSNWTQINEFKYFDTDYDLGSKVVEIENKVTGQSIIGLHMVELGEKRITEEKGKDLLWDCLSDTLESHKYTYIVGDLNAHNNEHRPDDKRSPEKLKMFTDKGYKDLVPDNYVTFYSAKTTVDHMYYNTEQVKADEGDFGLIPINLSDHACLVYESKEK